MKKVEKKTDIKTISTNEDAPVDFVTYPWTDKKKDPKIIADPKVRPPMLAAQKYSTSKGYPGWVAKDIFPRLETETQKEDFVNYWESVGRPKVKFYSDTTAGKIGGNTFAKDRNAFFNPLDNTIYISNKHKNNKKRYADMIIDELPHARQLSNDGILGFTTDMIGGILKQANKSTNFKERPAVKNLWNVAQYWKNVFDPSIQQQTYHEEGQWEHDAHHGKHAHELDKIVENKKLRTGGVYKKGGKKETESSNWDWINPVFLHQRVKNQIPINIRQFTHDIFGGKETITEEHLNWREKKALEEARKRAEARGSSSIEYQDYQTTDEGESVYSDVDSSVDKQYSKETDHGLAPLKKLLNTDYALKTTFGQIGFTKNDDGTYTYTDQYNFNNANKEGWKGWKKGVKQQGWNLYGQLRNIATNFGSMGGTGSDVRIKLRKGGRKIIKKKK